MAARTTVGVVSICHGYSQDILGWIESVRSLNRKPDKIVLVLNIEIDKSDFDLDGITVVGWFGDFEFSNMMNLAFENCNTDWVSWVGIDDRYRPHALDKIDTCVADVLALGFQYDTGQIWTPSKTTVDDILSLRANMIPCGSPIRRWLWEKISFDQSIAPCDDWAMWVGTALSGATYDATLNIDVDYAYAGHTVPDDSFVRATISKYLAEQSSRIN